MYPPPTYPAHILCRDLRLLPSHTLTLPHAPHRTRARPPPTRAPPRSADCAYPHSLRSHPPPFASLAQCPHGDDPLSIAIDHSQGLTTSLELAEAQNVTVQAVGAPMNGGQITFSYTDAYGGTWTSRPVDLPLIKTIHNKNGHLKGTHFNWENMAVTATVSDTVVSPGYHEHTLSGSDAASFASRARKGDWIVFGTADTTSSGQCLAQVYEDATDLTTHTLRTVADDSRGPCNSPGTTVYAAWSVLQKTDGSKAFAGTTYSATGYDDTTGVLTVSAIGSGELAKVLFPGEWIRVFDESAAGGEYCDFQVVVAPDGASDVTTITVAPTTASSTRADRIACKTFAGKTYGIARINEHKALKTATTAWPVAPTDKFTITIASGVAEVNYALNNNAAKPFDASGESIDIRPGALVYLYTATAFSCACQVTLGPTAELIASNKFRCVDPPALPGAVALTSCAAATHTAFNTAAVGEMFVMGGAGSVYFDADDVDQPAHFGDLSVGDRVTLSNLDATPSASQGVSGVMGTFAVARIDASTPTTLYFPVGVAPNGGGMLPIPALYALDTVAASTYETGPAAFSVGAGGTVQVYYGSKSATWGLTDTACVNSARRVKAVLEALPDRVVDAVNVTMTANTAGLYAYTVAFSGARVRGNQNELIVNAKGCNADGCQPRYSGVRVLTAFVSSVVTLAPGSVGTSNAAAVDFSKYVAATGGDLLAFYQAGAMNGKTATTTLATASDITLWYDGAASSVASSLTGVQVLKALGDASSVNGKLYFKTETTEIVQGTTENKECSGRGKCLRETGDCLCYEGYMGEACGQQFSQV